MSNAMTQSEFESMVRRAEALAQASPARYKLGIVLYSLLGYLFILLILFLLFGLAGLVIGSAFLSTALFLILLKKKLIFVLIPAIWILLKALWVRFDPPAGYVLKLRDFPALEREIRELQGRLKSLKVHQVILTPEFNAAVVQTPRLGIFGWHRNTLILGLELLLSLSPEQARSVLAHEFGHLSGNHSRFKGWIYRVRTAWDKVTQAYEGVDSWGARLMFRFFNWYSPRFSAYTFPLARMNEYEADAVAARITSPRTVVEALVSTHVNSGHADKDYWTLFYRKADVLPEPDLAPWSGFASFISERRLSETDFAGRLREALARETSCYDTHPSLKDRAAALKVAPEAPGAVAQTAAALWLGECLQQVIADFDREWMQANREKWQERYRYVCEGRAKLAALEGRPLENLSDDELWSKATLSEELIGDGDALPLYLAMQARYPQSPQAAFAVGRMLYNRGDEACLELMKIALASPQLALDACRFAYRFLDERKRMEEARWWERHYEEQNRILEESRRERARLNPGEALEKAGLAPEVMSAIAQALKSNRNVRRAWVARKALKYYPEYPAYAFVVEIKGFIVGDADKRAVEIIRSLNLDISADFFAFSKNGDYKKLARQVIKAGEQLV